MQLEQVGFCSIKLHKFPVELRKTRDRDFVGRLRISKFHNFFFRIKEITTQVKNYLFQIFKSLFNLSNVWTRLKLERQTRTRSFSTRSRVQELIGMAVQ